MLVSMCVHGLIAEQRPQIWQNCAGQFLTGHDLFLKRVGAAFVDFIQHTEMEVRSKCKEDLISTTRYITWSLHTRSGFGLRNIIGDVRLFSSEELVVHDALPA